MTALQELIHFLHTDSSLEEINENLQVHDIVFKIYDLLKKEKQQLLDEYNKGYQEGYHDAQNLH